MHRTQAKKERSNSVSWSQSQRRRLFALVVLFVCLLLFSLCIGRYGVPLKQLLTLFFDPNNPSIPDPVRTVIWQIRLPRILAAAWIGAALAVSGSVYQGLFKNPLVSPDVLGSSHGAGFGAALGILWGLHYAGISLLAFCGGICTVSLTVFFAKRYRRDPLLGLVLSGIMTGSLVGAGLSFVKLVADPMDQLPSITYWLMGSLASIQLGDLKILLPLLTLSFIPLYLLRYRLNLSTLGEEEARSLGVNLPLLRGIIIFCATLLTAGSVAFTGLIGWIGLVVPHLARQWVGPSYPQLLPASALLGASFLLAVDSLSRNLLTVEIPLGILTALVGAPFFLYLIYQGRRSI